MEPVTVRFDCSKPGTHLIRVTQQFPATPAALRTFRMAAWVPGSYKIRDFGRHVQDATVPAKGMTITQTGKDAWQVTGTANKPVEVIFDVYCRELTVDTSHVTTEHAHLFPATLVLYDEDSRARPHAVSLDLPAKWRAYSGLETPALNGTLAQADDYDHLIDCPIEAGPASAYHETTFTVRRKKHRLVTWQPPAGADWTRITRDVKAIVEATAKLWGGLPYDHYTFLSHVAQDHGGGLEHRNSTVLGVDPNNLLVEKHLKNKFYPLVAHEFFHTWNVKRIQPAVFQPYNLQTEVYTDLLWLFEGFTTYYELPLLARAGVVEHKDVGTLAAEMLKYYEMAAGRKRRSVAECSRLTWSLLYQPHEHNVNRNVSYYTKGLFVGLCLDWHLRQSGVADGLDPVMRELWRCHQSTGIPEDGFATIVKQATGKDVATLLRGWTQGTSELPIDKALAYFGFTVKRVPSDEKKPHGLGVQFKPKSNIIERIVDTSPSFPNLQPDDELVAVQGYRWKTPKFLDLAAGMNEGDDVEVALFREGRLLTRSVPISKRPADKITVEPTKGNATATRHRKAWLTP